MCILRFQFIQKAFIYRYTTHWVENWVLVLPYQLTLSSLLHNHNCSIVPRGCRGYKRLFHKFENPLQASCSTCLVANFKTIIEALYSIHYWYLNKFQNLWLLLPLVILNVTMCFSVKFTGCIFLFSSFLKQQHNALQSLCKAFLKYGWHMS